MEEIECVQSFKFLGLIVDNRLNFNAFYDEFYKKISVAGYIVRKMSSFVRTCELKLLYYAYVHSLFLYGIIIWGTMISKSNIENLYKVQKCILQSIFKVHYNAHIITCFKDINLLILQDQVDFECLKFMYQVHIGLVPVPIKKMYRQPNHNYLTQNFGFQNVKHSLNLINTT